MHQARQPQARWGDAPLPRHPLVYQQSAARRRPRRLHAQGTCTLPGWKGLGASRSRPLSVWLTWWWQACRGGTRSWVGVCGWVGACWAMHVWARRRRARQSPLQAPRGRASQGNERPGDRRQAGRPVRCPPPPSHTPHTRRTSSARTASSRSRMVAPSLSRQYCLAMSGAARCCHCGSLPAGGGRRERGGGGTEGALPCGRLHGSRAGRPRRAGEGSSAAPPLCLQRHRLRPARGAAFPQRPCQSSTHGCPCHAAGLKAGRAVSAAARCPGPHPPVVEREGSPSKHLRRLPTQQRLPPASRS
jgi:hypothetical protein